MIGKPRRPRTKAIPAKPTKGLGFDSKMEEEVSLAFKELGWEYQHSKKTYNFVGTYEVDFELPHFGEHVIVEVKGFFRDPAEMAKYVHVKKANPDIKMIFIVKNPMATYRRGVRASINDWCNKNGFLCLGLAKKDTWDAKIKEWLNG